MLIEASVNYCDFTGVEYDDYVSGGAILARGATGRWCQVMWAGPEWVAQHIASGGEIFTAEEAESHIMAMSGVNTIDF